jgi:hypothetical protein
MEEVYNRVLDTLYRITSIDGGYSVVADKQSWFSYSVSIGDILTVLGFAVTLFIFYRQLKESRKEGKSNLRSNWFLDVIVQPNMAAINELYIIIVDKANQNRISLRQRYENSDSAKEINLDLARKQREAKDYIKDFFDHFRTLLMASEPGIARQTDAIVDELVDIVTKYMDDYESGDTESCKRKVLANKVKLIALLYKGMDV